MRAYVKIDGHLTMWETDYSIEDFQEATTELLLAAQEDGDVTSAVLFVVK